MSPPPLQYLIQNNEKRLNKLFSNGYQEIYRRVHGHLSSFMRQNPLLDSMKLLIPTHQVLGHVIDMKEAKRYVKRQLSQEGVKVVGEDATSFFVTWSVQRQKRKQHHSQKPKRREHKKPAIVVDSSSSDSEGEPTVKKMPPPPIHVPIPKPIVKQQQPPPQPQPVPKLTPKASGAEAPKPPHGSNTKLPAKIEAQLDKLHLEVLKAMSGC